MVVIQTSQIKISSIPDSIKKDHFPYSYLLLDLSGVIYIYYPTELVFKMYVQHTLTLSL